MQALVQVIFIVFVLGGGSMGGLKQGLILGWLQIPMWVSMSQTANPSSLFLWDTEIILI